MPTILSLHVCSFCFHVMKDSHHMIAGPVGVSICEECVKLCSEIIAEAKSKQAAKEAKDNEKEL